MVEEFAKHLNSFVLTLCLHLDASTECFGDVFLKEPGVEGVHNLNDVGLLR